MGSYGVQSAKTSSETASGMGTSLSSTVEQIRPVNGLTRLVRPEQVVNNPPFKPKTLFSQDLFSLPTEVGNYGLVGEAC